MFQVTALPGLGTCGHRGHEWKLHGIRQDPDNIPCAVSVQASYCSGVRGTEEVIAMQEAIPPWKTDGVTKIGEIAGRRGKGQPFPGNAAR